MYKQRIKTWKLCKNIKREDKELIIRDMRQRRLVRQTLSNGRQVFPRIVRYCRENQVSPTDLMAAYSDLNETLIRPNTDNANTNHNENTNPNENAKHNAQPAPNFQTLLAPAFQPARTIAFRGTTLTSNIVIHNIEVYMDHYFTEGPGTWYYTKEYPTNNSYGILQPSQSLALVKNGEAWKDVLNPVDVYHFILEAFRTLNSDSPGLAFANMNKGLALVETMFKQQDPKMLPYLFEILLRWERQSSSLAQAMYRFIRDMVSTVLGKTHPLSIIIHQLCTFSTAKEKGPIWHALTDALGRAFAPLSDPRPLKDALFTYLNGLECLGLLNEAQDFSSVVFGQVDTGESAETAWEAPWCLRQKANLLYRQGRYQEAETLYQECLVRYADHAQHILAFGTASPSLQWSDDIDDCLFLTAKILSYTDKIDEAKTMWSRALDFDSAAFGPENVATQLTGSYFADFLTQHSFWDEAEELRRRYPWLEARTEI